MSEKELKRELERDRERFSDKKRLQGERDRYEWYTCLSYILHTHQPITYSSTGLTLRFSSFLSLSFFFFFFK